MHIYTPSREIVVDTSWHRFKYLPGMRHHFDIFPNHPENRYPLGQIFDSRADFPISSVSVFYTPILLIPLPPFLRVVQSLLYRALLNPCLRSGLLSGDRRNFSSYFCSSLPRRGFKIRVPIGKSRQVSLRGRGAGRFRKGLSG